jgi:hypothetical protein
VSPRSAEIAAFADGLASRGAVRVRLAALWELWAVAAPRLVGDPEQATELAAALDELSARGTLILPSGAWDYSTFPPLPHSVTVVGARRAPRERRWVHFPWRRELGWVSSLPEISEARFTDLVAVNSWLAHLDGGPVAVVPARYRSVELFGDEKRLEAIARTGLFGPGRLTFELLACVRIPAPLPSAMVGDGPAVLVVENSDTYWTAVDVLRGSSGHPIGAVAWGSGNAFPSQVSAFSVDLGGRGPVTGDVWYWGDLDPPGVAIAVEAARVAARAGGAVAVRPAAGLWAAMAERPVQDAGRVTWPDPAAGLSWFGAQVWHLFDPVRNVAGRVAQEAVPGNVIGEWSAAL